MIDRSLILRLSIVCAVVCVAAAGAGAALHSLAFAGGILLGGAVGLAPFLTWAWAARTKRRKLLPLLFFAKLAVYSGLFYLFVTRAAVNPFAVFIGITLSIAVCVVGAYARMTAQEAAR
jgi:hypothetical protein